MYLKTDFKTHSRQQTQDIPNKTSQYTITETNTTDTLEPQTALKHMTSPSSYEKQANLNSASTNTGLRDLATNGNAPFDVSLSFDLSVMILQLLINDVWMCRVRRQAINLGRAQNQCPKWWRSGAELRWKDGR